MSNIKLDLSKFKFHSTDGKSTTLVHEKDGHKITLAHKPLNEINRNQLEALSKMDDSAKKPMDKAEAKQDDQRLAEGGKVDKKKPKKEDDKPKKDGNATVHVPDTQTGLKHAEVLKKQGDAPYGSTIVVHDEKYALGGDVMSPEDEEKHLAIAQQIMAKRQAKAKQTTGAQPVKPVAKMADGGDVPEALTPPSAEEMTAPIMQDVGDPSKIPDTNIPYQEMAKRIYEEQKANNPGQPDIVSQKIALNAAQNAKQSLIDDRDRTAAREAESAKAQNSLASQYQALGMTPPSNPQAAPLPNAGIAEAAPQPEGIAARAPQAAAAAPQGGGLAGSMDGTEKMMQDAFNLQKAGIYGQAAAQQDLAKQQAQVLQDQVKAQQDAKLIYDKNYKELEGERQALMQDIKDNHVSVEKFWTGDKDGNGSHSKIMTGIGMILAGFNPTNSPNAAIQFLNKQMDMNLEAQKQNLNSRQNLLSANLRQFGNLKDATDMTRLMQADMVTNQLKQAAATASSPMAKAAAMQAAGQLAQQYAPIAQNFALRRAMINASQGMEGNPGNTAAAEQMIAYARLTNPEMAKEMETRLVPGVGMAKIPVPEKVRDEIRAHEVLQTQSQDLLNYSKKHTNLVPGTAEYNTGVQKAMILQQHIREGLLGTVFRESEKPLLEKFVDENPAGALKTFSTQPKIKTIIESNRMQLNMLKQNYGLPVQQPPPAEPVRGADGRMYIQKGNFMVPVSASPKK
jgi:hypothetical protein